VLGHVRPYVGIVTQEADVEVFVVPQGTHFGCLRRLVAGIGHAQTDCFGTLPVGFIHATVNRDAVCNATADVQRIVAHPE